MNAQKLTAPLLEAPAKLINPKLRITLLLIASYPSFLLPGRGQHRPPHRVYSEDQRHRAKVKGKATRLKSAHHTAERDSQ